MTMPQSPELTHDDFVALRPRSKSAMKDFLNCPELYRRMRVCGERDRLPIPLPMARGVAFHAAVASVWQQVWDKTKETK